MNQRPIPDLYNSFQRYLAAKVTVDDRALNRHVWDRLVAALPDQRRLGRPLRVLEVGAGIGTMIERFLTWLPHRDIIYTALDALPENIAEAHRRLPAWAVAHGLTVERDAGGRLRLGLPRKVTDIGSGRSELPAQTRASSASGVSGGYQAEIELVTADLFDFVVTQTDRPPYDLLIAHAFLDLVNIPATLPQLFAQLGPHGLFYFTLVFDGVTAFEPAIDRSFDDHVEALYHRTMDERIAAGMPSGDSRSGRHLFGHLAATGAGLLAAGASDWVVYPANGGYEADEAYFLHFIIHTVASALTGHPALDPDRFGRWIEQRHAQIEAGQLVYIAHQLDFLGRRPVEIGRAR
ncbi:MAG: class I SAM-dependent methyltransferase [Anaerolineae bacterium]|nr:class I SAM-dependent methyltransferase [Anaerolineae bacterium]